MCACSREERHYDPVTDDKTGTADTLAGTELDVRTFLRSPGQPKIWRPDCGVVALC